MSRRTLRGDTALKARKRYQKGGFGKRGEGKRNYRNYLKCLKEDKENDKKEKSKPLKI